MNDRILVLREAIGTITQMLAGKRIKVTQKGTKAYVKFDKKGMPEYVNLPYLPDNASDELCDAIQGYLDHEVGHLLFSDMKLMFDSCATPKGGQDGKLFSILNVVEDARIEKEMAIKFAGSGAHLSSVGKFLLTRVLQPELEAAIGAGDDARACQTLLMPLIRSMSGQLLFQQYMRDKMPYVEDVYDKLKDLAPRMESMKSTADAINISREIKKRLIPEMPPSSGGELGDGDSKEGGKPKRDGSPSPKGEPKKSGDKPEKPEGDKSEKGEKPEEEEKPEGAEPSEDDGDSESGTDGGSGDSDSESEEADGETDGSGGSDGEADKDSESTRAKSSDEEPGDSGKSSGSEPLAYDPIDPDKCRGLEDVMSEVISSETEELMKKAPYKIFTTDYDVVDVLTPGSGYVDAMFKKVYEPVEQMVNALQKDLERAIAARSQAVWENGRRSGRLHTANLARLAATGDGRVFRKRHESTSKDVAVSMLDDASGSMRGENVLMAAQASYALSSTLERININHEVLGFTTKPTPHELKKEATEEQERLGFRYTRIEPLWTFILKSYNERLTSEVQKRFGWMAHMSSLNQNVDGESLRIAARRLLKRREAGKILIVLSDGEPCCHSYDMGALQEDLRDATREVEAAGIKVVGIGINTDSPRRYYRRSIVVNDINELPTVVIRQLRDMLLMP